MKMKLAWTLTLLLLAGLKVASAAAEESEQPVSPSKAPVRICDFEDQKPGEFKTLKTDLGVWSSTAGVALIDDHHSATGERCLQLTGG
ncbi:MAG: hypothetical protein NXI22_05865, partial [bacterium]|nr:hypothetical protein [bacterium]